MELEARSLRPSADDAWAVLAAWSLEDSDRAGALVPLDARRKATQAAVGAGGDQGDGDQDADGDDWIVARARTLRPDVERALGGGRLTSTDPLAGWTWLVLIVALGAGLATNALGPERLINVLAVPLLGLVAWNLVVVTIGLVRLVLPPAWGGLEVDRPPKLLRAIQRRVRSYVLRRALRRDEPDETEQPDEGAVRRDALALFLKRWTAAAAPLHAARLRRLLHLAAIVTVLGVVLGMYARGVLFEYRATWESTFLDGDAVDRLLGAVLGPAAGLLGVEVPSAAALERPETGPAGRWIHLWAVTAVLFVGLPRGVLALIEQLRAARLRRRLPVQVSETYLRRLRIGAATAEHAARILPYSYRPIERAVRHLKGAILDLLGPRARIRLVEPASYGDAAPEAAPGDLRVVLFGLAQTPEAEVHGEVIEALRGDLPDGQGLLAVVDEGPYRRRLEGRLGADAEDRLRARRRAWTRVVHDAGLEAVFVDLDEAIDDATLEALAAAVWPPGAGGLAWTS